MRTSTREEGSLSARLRQRPWRGGLPRVRAAARRLRCQVKPQGTGLLLRASRYLSIRRVRGVMRRRADTGSVTAEFAVVLPAVMVVALVLLSLGRAVLVGVECQDGARAAARELAVSQEVDGRARTRARSAAAKVAGAAASVALAPADGMVRVTLTCPLLPGPLRLIPANVTGEAAAMLQQTG